ncbi:MAG: hypothetical protein K0U74_12655 [Alphaproteobacteria bacterium]|nr:hypothetical protein [Alphaproteobacteria bacterium]
MAPPTATDANEPDGDRSIEKIMTLSQSEFAHSIRSFAGEEQSRIAATGAPIEIPVGPGKVTISFEKIEGFSFGGLVEMPRARVVLAFSGVPEADKTAFLRRFDISFQRGGG